MEKASWYTGILTGMTGALGKFVSIFKKHGFVYVTLVLILFVSCYTLIINPIRIDKLVEKRIENMYAADKQREAETIQRRIQADQIVGDIMTRMVDKFTAIHRVLLLEAHNSLKSLQNVDFLYFSATMEMLTPNSRHMVYLADDLQRQMRLNLVGNNMIQTMKHRNYLYYNNISECNHPEHRLIHKLADTGDKEAIIIPFLNDNNEPVMLLVVSGDSLPVNDIIEYVDEFRKQIEACLM